MTQRNPTVTERIAQSTRWNTELSALRELVLASGLTETLKWEEPCYTYDSANVLIIHGFKDYCALLFFKGVLMQDPQGILIQQTEHVQAGRQIRITTLAEIQNQQAIIMQYLQEAIAVEQSGKKITYKKTDEYDIPDELQDAFSMNPGFREAFQALTPGRQRGYLLYFSGAKQSKTREERIEKAMDAIFDGLGIHDEYRLSQKSE
jgi:uncharacterized protein YdeI (YjbR/CyaY-like superfamily)